MKGCNYETKRNKLIFKRNNVGRELQITPEINFQYKYISLMRTIFRTDINKKDIAM